MRLLRPEVRAVAIVLRFATVGAPDRLDMVGVKVRAALRVITGMGCGLGVRLHGPIVDGIGHVIRECHRGKPPGD